MPGRLRNQSINAFRVKLRSVQFLRHRFQKALHSFDIRWEIARVFFPPTDRATNYRRGSGPESVAEIPALFLAKPQQAGFPPSNASSFFARARRCFNVSVGFADFFRFPFLEPIDLALRRFN